MKRCRFRNILPLLAGLTLLTACEQRAGTESNSEAASVELPGGMTVKDRIETRQAQLKKMGKAFKAISDQLKSRNPDVAEIQAAAAVVPKESETMADWFPDGTGPESGIETEALPIIWGDKPDFQAKILAMRDAAAQLSTAAQGGDVAAIATAFQATGGKCKACHDKYRLDD